ncbi:MAG: hypothetical protein M1820_006339 [Bogoriella megaspora]|nr:MAG: hypothetical protein M1820_006339 [Bogoriella megaspora]
MSDLLASYMLKPNVLKALYCGNLAIAIAFKASPYMMRKLSKRSQSKSAAISSTPEGDEWHHDIAAYLGFINVGFAVLAGLRLRGLVKSPTSKSTKELDLLALMVLAVANGSQAWGNFVRVRGNGRWIVGTGWDRITVLDTVFMVLDSLAALAYASKH